MDSTRSPNRIIFGLIVVACGVLLFLDNLGVDALDGAWRWFPSIFILWGVVMLVSRRFQDIAGPVIMIVIAALVQVSFLGGDVWAFILPGLLIIIGAAVVIGSLRGRKKDDSSVSEDYVTDDASKISISQVAGSTNRIIESASFEGGEVKAVMGSVELDMRDTAVEYKPATLDVNCVMAEVKLRVPANWRLRVNIDTTLGETKDERSHRGDSGDEVDLVITGSVVMGHLVIDD